MTDIKIGKLVSLVKSEGRSCHTPDPVFYTCVYCSEELNKVCVRIGMFSKKVISIKNRFNQAKKELKKISKEEIFELLL